MNFKKRHLCASVIITIFILVFTDSLFSQAEKVGYPYFDEKGILNIIFFDEEGTLWNRQIKETRTTDRFLKKAFIRGKVFSPQIKRGSNDCFSIIWEQQDITKNDIYFGQIKNNILGSIQNISSDFNGINHSPSLYVSHENDIWVAWINHLEDYHSLIIKNITSQRTWAFVSSQDSPLFSPQIIVDGFGKVWVFWVSPIDGLDQIYYSFFDGSTWKKPAAVNPNPYVPQFHPTVATELNGNPWVAWSAYDGEDYEIYVSFWDGSDWAKEEKISNNEESADAQPSLFFFMSSIPVIAWTHAREGSSDIFLSYKNENRWSLPLNVSQDSEKSFSPVVLSENNQVAVFWKEPKQLKLKVFSFLQLQISKKARYEKREKVIYKESSNLLKESFIAFGDSITYGWMNGDAKEKGYVPRLQDLLHETFEDPNVINRGVPGEPTWEALSRIVSVITSDLALYLFLMEGTNDASILDYSMDTTAFNLREMVNKCFQYDVFPLISTIIPRAGYRWTSSAKQRTFYLNKRIKEIAEDLGIFFIDNFMSFYSFPDDQGGFESLIADGLHPNEDGYQLMAETWYDKIKIIPFPPSKIEALKKRREKTIILSWQKNSKIIPETELKNYYIFRRASGEKNYILVSIVDSSVFTYQDKNISIEEDYKYVIRAANLIGLKGPPSDPITPIIGDPFPPINIKVGIVVNKAFLYKEYINRITWNSNKNNLGLFEIKKYRIYRKRKGEANEKFLLIGEANGSTYNFLDRGFSSFENAALYTYGISSVDKNDIEGPIGIVETIETSNLFSNQREALNKVE